jgi:hypothetical protein
MQFTVRGLMVAVAVVGAAAWGMGLWRKSRTYSEQAKSHESMVWGLTQGYPGPEGREPQIEHFKKLARKYRSAARSPWLRIEPDPPIPPETERIRLRREYHNGYAYGFNGFDGKRVRVQFLGVDIEVGNDVIVLSNDGSRKLRLKAAERSEDECLCEIVEGDATDYGLRDYLEAFALPPKDRAE